MHKIDTNDHVANEFSDGNPLTGQEATVLDAAFANAVRGTGALVATRSLAEEHVDHALAVLEELPAGPAREALVTVALASLERAS